MSRLTFQEETKTFNYEEKALLLRNCMLNKENAYALLIAIATKKTVDESLVAMGLSTYMSKEEAT